MRKSPFARPTLRLPPDVWQQVEHVAQERAWHKNSTVEILLRLGLSIDGWAKHLQQQGYRHPMAEIARRLQQGQ